MNGREKVLSCLNFDKGSRSVKAEFAFWYETLDRWYGEGLPKGEGLPEQAIGHNIRSNFNTNFLNEKMVDNDVCHYFDFDFKSHSILNDFSPMYEKVTIEENDEFIIFKDDYGITQKRLKDERGGIRSSMPMYLDFPIGSKDDFLDYKERVSTDFEKRMETDWVKTARQSRSEGQLIMLCGRSNGFFWFPRKTMGLERFLMTIYDDPVLLNDMLDFILDTTISFWEYILEKVEVDFVLINEDMAFKGGPLLSLESFRELLEPRYMKLTDFLKKYKIKNIFVDSDGDMTSLIPLLLNSGISGILPFEVTGSMDLIKIRKDYPGLQIAGGINKMKLFGDKKEIDNELEKVPHMLKKGGYIPFVDHSVPPLISWDNFVYYREKLNDIIFQNPME
ncbi:MAG: uroporphyrinogen decarboxylase family protein [Candidatus Humimicrobiaceae bacterium]